MHPLKPNKKALDASVEVALDNIDDRFSGRKHLVCCVVERPKNLKKFGENIELFRPEGDFSEEEVIQFKTDWPEFPINLVISTETVEKLQEKYIPPISARSRATSVLVHSRKITPKKTKNGKDYWIVEALDSNNESTCIRCWGIKLIKAAIHLNRLYMARLKYDENWGFSTYAVGKHLNY